MKKDLAKSGKSNSARIVLLYLLLFSFFVSCSDKPEVELSSEAKIESFSFSPIANEGLEVVAQGSMSGSNIIVSVPYGVSLDGLVATFAYSGESVKVGDVVQKSGETSNDFTNPVVYSVIAEDGTENNYTVTVTKNQPRIPRVYITTEGNAPILDKENYVTSTVRVEDIDKYYSSDVTFTSNAGVRGRGNSTWGQPKKPYRIKLDKKEDESQSYSILGMSDDRDWALLANYFDKTLLRNITAFEIAEIAEMDWTPSSISVDFYLNGSYQGVYTLTEHVKVSEERLDLDLVKSSDNSGEALTGDYFLELDFHFDEPSKFRTKRVYQAEGQPTTYGLPIMFKDPDEPSQAQFDYVENFFNTAEEVLYSDNFRDPVNGYRKYIDVESFINYYIVQELAKNVDGNMRGSCYLALRRNGKIEQPLVWDFDLAFGNAKHIVWEQGASSDGPGGWYLKTNAPWFDRFFEDPDFVAELKNRWNELKPQFDEIPDFIREQASKLTEPQSRNFGPRPAGAGWDINAEIWPHYTNRGSYGAEVSYLIYFVEERLKWLDTNINAL